MKFAVFSFAGEGLPVAKHLIDEGQEVIVGMIQDAKEVLTDEELKTYKPEKPEDKRKRLSLYEGIIKRSSADQIVGYLKKQPDPENWFIFFDFNNGFRYADKLKGLGFNGNFPTQEDRKLEVDREYAKEFVKRHYPQITVGENHEFKTMEDCKSFLEGTQDIWVLKPFSEESKTFVPASEDPEEAKQEVLTALLNDKESFEREGFILEIKIPECIEITPQKVWYNGKPVFTDIDIEQKRLGASEVGSMTGCAFDLVFQTTETDEINRVAFPSIVDDMAAEHEGMFIWDLSILVDPKNGRLYMGEFCPNRNGYNALYNELGQAESVHEYFEKIVAGESPFRRSNIVGVSLKLFQVAQSGVKEDMEITAQDDKHLWMMDVKKGLKTCGVMWDTAVITAHGETIQEAIDRLYGNIGLITFDNKYYRSKGDILATDYYNSTLNRFRYGNGKLYNSPIDAPPPTEMDLFMRDVNSFKGWMQKLGIL